MKIYQDKLDGTGGKPLKVYNKSSPLSNRFLANFERTAPPGFDNLDVKDVLLERFSVEQSLTRSGQKHFH